LRRGVNHQPYARPRPHHVAEEGGGGGLPARKEEDATDVVEPYARKTIANEDASFHIFKFCKFCK